MTPTIHRFETGAHYAIAIRLDHGASLEAIQNASQTLEALLNAAVSAGAMAIGCVHVGANPIAITTVPAPQVARVLLASILEREAASARFTASCYDTDGGTEDASTYRSLADLCEVLTAFLAPKDAT